MKKKRLWYLIAFNVFYLLFVILLPVLFFFLLNALMMRGFGALLPLWVRFIIVFTLFWIFAHRSFKKRLAQLSEGQITKSQFISFFKKKMALLAALIVLVILWHHYAHQKYLKTLFKGFFAEKYIKKVNLIEGSYFAWQDYYCYFTFTTDKDTFTQIAKDYKTLPAQPIAKDFFTTDIAAKSALAAYHRKRKVSDKVYDSCFILWDENTGTAYFHAHNGFYSEADETEAEFTEQRLAKRLHYSD
jgi:hypothetical protein